MGMTLEHKKKCTDLYESYTGYYIEPHHWNEAAANCLAEFVNEVIKCTHGMGMVRAIWPSTTRITWLYLIRIPEKIYRNEKKLAEGYINTACLTYKLVNGHKLRIEKAILDGKK
jgi:hypothetical protein